MSRVQVLVATMNQEDFSLISKMNIKTDAIVGNQCLYNSYNKTFIDGNEIIYLNFNERGVGLNRNNCLMRATGEFCLFADDDMIYVDEYEKLICEAFDKNEKADVIVINLIEANKERPVIEKRGKVHFYNYLRYGTARIAVRLSSIKQNGIYFNQCFGGGTEHCHGEDNLFLTSCLKAGLKILALPISVAYLLNERESTWNKGYDEKYLKDQGILYKTISKRYWKLLCLQDALRHHKTYGLSFWKSYRIMRGK